jgi:hypothetical protein
LFKTRLNIKRQGGHPQLCDLKPLEKQCQTLQQKGYKSLSISRGNLGLHLGNFRHHQIHFAN